MNENDCIWKRLAQAATRAPRDGGAPGPGFATRIAARWAASGPAEPPVWEWFTFRAAACALALALAALWINQDTLAESWDEDLVPPAASFGWRGER